MSINESNIYIDKGHLIYSVPSVLTPGNLEQDFENILELTAEKQPQIVIFDFSEVITAITFGILRLKTLIESLILMGANCRVISISSHFAGPFSDYMHKIKNVSYHKNLLDAVDINIAGERSEVTLLVQELFPEDEKTKSLKSALDNALDEKRKKSTIIGTSSHHVKTPEKKGIENLSNLADNETLTSQMLQKHISKPITTSVQKKETQEQSDLLRKNFLNENKESTRLTQFSDYLQSNIGILEHIETELNRHVSNLTEEDNLTKNVGNDPIIEEQSNSSFQNREKKVNNG